MLSKWSECTEGWYGVNCSQTCSRHCRDSTKCNHVTGQCEKGCDTGWTGSLCTKGKRTYYDIKWSHIKSGINADEQAQNGKQTKTRKA